MRLVVTTESRYLRTPDGRVWTRTEPARELWARYLAVFEAVRVVARVADVPTVPAPCLRVDGDGIEVWPVPHYVGPWQFLLRRHRVRRAVTGAAARDDAVVLRLPSPIGTLLAGVRRRNGLPFAVEVVGDPYEVFAPGVVAHPLRGVFRVLASRTLRRLCRQASCVAYVTRQVLQRRYPAASTAVTASYSSVQLPDEAFAAGPRRCGAPPYTLICVGSLEQLYKGIDTLLYALAALLDAGVPVRLIHVGDGRYRTMLAGLAADLAIEHAVTFTGVLPPGGPVRAQLDAADLFVLPSRTEGLPRALLEAMARGLPAIGSHVGGIPELLPAQFLVAADDPGALAERIAAVLYDPTLMAAAAKRNLDVASSFRDAQLAPIRQAWYQAVRSATEGTGVRTAAAANVTGRWIG